MNMRVGRRYRTVSSGDSMENILSLAARISIIVVGVVVATAALDIAQIILAPVFLAIVVGLMFGPAAEALERRGAHSALSAALVVLIFMLLVAAILASVAVPLSQWARYLPVIWEKLQAMISDWRDIFATLDGVRDTLQSAIGSSGRMEVQVEEDSTVESAAWLAPAILMQVVLFLVSLFFFVAHRNAISRAILSLCFERRLRWRVAHVFRDVEAMVSRYLLSITAVNLGLMVAVSAAMWALGVPSPLLWGVLAGILNYIVYVGPAIMVGILFCVGLATADTTLASLAPAVVYVCINALESQLVTPLVIGRTLTLNPFLVFLAIGFWLWVWGPVGGFVAIPALLIMVAILRHVIPGSHRRQASLVNSR
jgi:predicted PurR-regulated permease PerM